MNHYKEGYAFIQIGPFGHKTPVYVSDHTDEEITVTWPNQDCKTYKTEIVHIVSKGHKAKDAFQRVERKC